VARLPLVLGLCLLFASMDEVRQWFSITRGGSIVDVLLDMSGASSDRADCRRSLDARLQNHRYISDSRRQIIGPEYLCEAPLKSGQGESRLN